MTTVLLAGASGDLGERTARALVARDADVRALTRTGAGPDKTARLEALGLTVVEADYDDAAALTRACGGVDVVVSAVSGARSVIVDGQSRLTGPGQGWTVRETQEKTAGSRGSIVSRSQSTAVSP